MKEVECSSVNSVGRSRLVVVERADFQRLCRTVGKLRKEIKSLNGWVNHLEDRLYRAGQRIEGY